MVGFDGSQVDGGPPAVAAHLAPIFVSHATPAYVGTVREVRDARAGGEPRARRRRHGAGGPPRPEPGCSTPSTRLIAVQAGGTWRAAMFQSTPAAFHGRPDLAQALTEELRGAAAEAPHARSRAPGPSGAMSGVGNTARWIAASRAKESELALPLFSDPYARELSGEAGFELQKSMRAAMGAPGDGPDLYLSIRTKFLDDALVQAVRVAQAAPGGHPRGRHGHARVPHPLAVRA